MKQLSLLVLVSTVHQALATGSHHHLHVCNRGFCYNKKDDRTRRGGPSLQQKKKRGGLNVCTGDTANCELYAILGSDFVDEEEAIECLNCPSSQQTEQPNDTRPELDNFEILEDVDLDQRRSWKEDPKKGSCYDSDLGYLFDCNLIEMLE
jgi:hypothetical protein